MAQPIATLTNGNILYSDGTQRPNNNIASTNRVTAPAAVKSYQSPTNNTNASYSSTPDSGGYDYNAQYNAQLKAYEEASNRYIDDLLSMAGEDRDTAINLLTREHEQALGTNNQERAKFLESVSDKLEKRIGTIPYDYQVGVTRTNEDITYDTNLTNRNRESALKRLAEDEQVWKQDFANTSKSARTSQQEDLLKRGLIQGTRDNIQGVGGVEVGNLERDLSGVLSSYDRALGRDRADINQASEDALFDINRTGTRTLEDLKTGARRSASIASDTYTDQTKAAELAYQRKQKELEKQRELAKLQAQTYALPQQ